LEGVEVSIVLESQIGARYGAPLKTRLVERSWKCQIVI